MKRACSRFAACLVLISANGAIAQTPDFHDGFWVSSSNILRFEDGKPELGSVWLEIFRSKEDTFSRPIGFIWLSGGRISVEGDTAELSTATGMNGNLLLAYSMLQTATRTSLAVENGNLVEEAEYFVDEPGAEEVTTNYRFTYTPVDEYTMTVTTEVEGGATDTQTYTHHSFGVGTSQSDPVVPRNVDWTEPVDIMAEIRTPGIATWIDPPYASGFSYQVIESPINQRLIIQEVELPTGFGSSMEVWAKGQSGEMELVATSGAGNVDIAGALDLYRGTEFVEVRGLRPIADLAGDAPFPIGIIFTSEYPPNYTTGRVTIRTTALDVEDVTTPVVSPTATPRPTPTATSTGDPGTDSSLVVAQLNNLYWSRETIVGVFDEPDLPFPGGKLVMSVVGNSTNTFGSWVTMKDLAPLAEGLYELEVDVVSNGVAEGSRIPDFRMRVFGSDALSQYIATESAKAGEPLPATITLPFRSMGNETWRIAFDILSFTPEQTGGFEITGIRIVPR